MIHMEPQPPLRPPDLPGSSSFKPLASPGERFSVQDVERQVRSTSRRTDYSTSRSRREKRAEESGLDRYIWFFVALITAAYLAYLAWHVIKPGVPRAAPAIMAVPVIEPAVETPVLETAVDVQAVDSDPVVLLKLEETVASLKRAKQLHEDAVRLMRDKRLGEAEEKFEEAVSLMPGNFLVLFDWANLLREQKRWSAARDQLLKAIVIDPSSVPARIALAQCCFQLHQLPDALAMAKWALEAEAYSEPAHQIAADVYFGLDQYHDAIIHLQKLVALNSNNRIAANNLGAAYLRLGQSAQAIRTFEKIIGDEPSNSQAYYYLALGFVQKSEPELAVDVLVRAASQFGREFVLSWTKSQDFASLQTLASFQQHFAVPVAAPDPVPVAP